VADEPSPEIDAPVTTQGTARSPTVS